MLVRAVQIVILCISLRNRPSQQYLEIIFARCVITRGIDGNQLFVRFLATSKFKFARFSKSDHSSCLVNQRFVKLVSF